MKHSQHPSEVAIEKYSIILFKEKRTHVHMIDKIQESLRNRYGCDLADSRDFEVETSVHMVTKTWKT